MNCSKDVSKAKSARDERMDVEIDAFDSEVLTSLFAAWRGKRLGGFGRKTNSGKPLF